MTMQKLKNFRFWGIFALVIVLATLAVILGSPSILSANGAWEATYWNNPIMSGEPILQRYEPEINYDWKGLSPDVVVNVDNFSARWRRQINVPAGVYRFSATTDDGMKVFVDGMLVIDSWYDSKAHTVTADFPLNEGQHSVVVEYYESGGNAVAGVSWVLISSGNPGPGPGQPPGGGMGPGPSQPPGGSGGMGGPNIMNWLGEYYNNMQLSGSPALVRDDSQIDFDWGTGSPAPQINNDNFSVRWTRQVNLNPGRYRFETTTDDGVRLWVNGQIVIDRWYDQAETTYYAEIDVPGGATSIKMEYYENAGMAVAELHWQPVGGTTPPPPQNWKGEYFTNMTLSGTPALVRDDQQIQFNWGYGSPVASIPSDNFSVRWTRNLNLEPGRYRFSATTDDGVRLWVNNQMVIDAWYDHAVQTFTADVDVAGGSIPVKMDYYENFERAEARLSWQKIGGGGQGPGGPGTGGPHPTAIVTASYLNVRKGPGPNFAVVTTITKGTEVRLAGYRNADASWVQVMLMDQTKGWVNASYIHTDYPLENLQVWPGGGMGGANPNLPTATVNASYLNVRNGPGTNYAVITTITRGQTVILLGRTMDATWAKVRLGDGAVGWVSVKYINSETPIQNLPVVS